MVISPDDYEIRIFYSPVKGDECFIATVTEMPGVSAWGDTHEDALKEIKVALRGVLETYLLDNEDPPVPIHGGWAYSTALEGMRRAAKKAEPAKQSATTRKAPAARKTASPSRKSRVAKKAATPKAAASSAPTRARLAPAQKIAPRKAPTAAPSHTPTERSREDRLAA